MQYAYTNMHCICDAYKYIGLIYVHYIPESCSVGSKRDRKDFIKIIFTGRMIYILVHINQNIVKTLPLRKDKKLYVNLGYMRKLAFNFYVYI